MKKSLSLFVLVVFIALIFTACNNDPAHVHEWGEWETTTEATCTKDGVATRKCKTCGNLDKETQVIKALGHDWGKGTVKAEATCAAEGKKEYTCSRCKETKTEPIAKKDHTYGDLQTTEATCTADGEKYRSCSVCEDKKVEETIDKLGHDWDEGTVKTASTCKAEGEKEFKCSRCDETKTEPIAKTDHTYGDLQTKAATCKEDGKEYRICSVCGDEKVEKVLPKTDSHTWDTGVVTNAATCGEAGVKTYTCSVCETTKTEGIAATGEHSYGEEQTKAATCKEEGKTYQVCSVCGDEKVNSTIAKIAHTFDSGVITTEPTCKNTGVKTYTCSVCGETKTETVPVDSTKHVYSWVTDTEATFTKARTEKEVCSVCDEAGSTRVTDEYKSMTGYWKSPMPKEMMGMEGFWYYFSFADDSSDAVGVDVLGTADASGTESALGRLDDSYSWTTDTSSGKRTEFNWTSLMYMYGGRTVKVSVYGSTVKNKDDETSKDTITLKMEWKDGTVDLVFERISEEPHEHTLSDNPSYTPSSMSYEYHTTPTQCDGDLHPQADYMLEHRYDETAENPELCLDCGAEKHYRISIVKGTGSGSSSFEEIYVTKSEGFTPGNTYTATDGTEYTNITSWKKVIGHSGTLTECPIGEKVELVDDYMTLVFYVTEE